jgi:hypothetical protein
MASIWSRIKAVSGLFSSKLPIVEDVKRATKAQNIKLGVSQKTIVYILKTAKRLGLSTPKWSVRKFQEAQTGVPLEVRAKEYKAGTRAKKTYQSKTKYPKRTITSAGRKLEYEDILWGDLPKYFERMKKYGKVQFKALGETEKKYEGNEGQWRTIRSNGGTEIKDFYDKINSETGFEGFSAHNLPTKGSFIVWKNSRKH